MIFGNITQEKTYAFLPEDLKECFAYAKEHDLVCLRKGHAIPSTEKGCLSMWWNMRPPGRRTASGKPTGITWMYI